MAKEQEVERKKNILDEHSDITAEKQTVSPLRDYSHTLYRMVKPLIITMTQHEKTSLLKRKKQPLHLMKILFS